MIIPVTLAAIAVLAGYVVVICGLLASTLALASSAPRFVETNHCLRPDYKVAQAAVWLACTALGAFITALIGERSWALPDGLGLAAILVTVLWTNTWDARQRGLASQILLTILTGVGVAIGYMIRF